MTNIFIARHGETEYNRTGRIQGRGINVSINDTGKRQAKAIAEALRDTKINHIFSSSLKRSIETADIVSSHLNVPVQSYPELDEMNFGIIEGKPINEIGSQLEELHSNWKSGQTGFALDNGESPDDVLERVLMRMDELTREHSGKNVLYVLHGRLIRILLAHWLEYGLSAMHRIEHQNGALYHLQLNGNSKYESVYLNNTDHL